MKKRRQKRSEQVRWNNTIKKELYIPGRWTNSLNIYSDSVTQPSVETVRLGEFRRKCEEIAADKELEKQISEVWFDSECD